MLVQLTEVHSVVCVVLFSDKRRLKDQYRSTLHAVVLDD